MTPDVRAAVATLLLAVFLVMSAAWGATRLRVSGDVPVSPIVIGPTSPETPAPTVELPKPSGPKPVHTVEPPAPIQQPAPGPLPPGSVVSPVPPSTTATVPAPAPSPSPAPLPPVTAPLITGPDQRTVPVDRTVVSGDDDDYRPEDEHDSGDDGH